MFPWHAPLDQGCRARSGKVDVGDEKLEHDERNLAGFRQLGRDVHWDAGSIDDRVLEGALARFEAVGQRVEAQRLRL